MEDRKESVVIPKNQDTSSTSEIKMSEKEFSEYLATHLNIKDFSCVSKFRSIKRAFKRKHISPYGVIYPKRPFNNRKNTSKRKGVNSRVMNNIKQQIYENLKRAV